MSGLSDILAEWANPPKSMVDKLPKGGTTLDYMGHAAVTRALIQVDPEWSWSPVVDERGIPVIEQRGKRLVMWGTVTVLGKTMVCCGTCEDRKFEPEKELIGDLLRNGAMRFGIGLALWAKDEWNDLGTSTGSGAAPVPSSRSAAPAVPSPAAGAFSGHGSPDQGGGPVDGPSPVDVINEIRGLDDQTRRDIKEYAVSKGYKVTPASLTVEGAADLSEWLHRRTPAA
jgi:hypothetical protein